MADKDEKYGAATEATAAVAESPPGKSRRRCPLCQGPLVEHGDASPYKVGACHCDACGVCWEHDLKNARMDHPMPKAPEPVEG